MFGENFAAKAVLFHLPHSGNIEDGLTGEVQPTNAGKQGPKRQPVVFRVNTHLLDSAKSRGSRQEDDMPGFEGRPVSPSATFFYDALHQSDTAFLLTVTTGGTSFPIIADAEVQAGDNVDGPAWTSSATAGTITAKKKVTVSFVCRALLAGDEAATVAKLAVKLDSTVKVACTKTVSTAAIANAVEFFVAGTVEMDAGEVLAPCVSADDDGDVITVHSYAFQVTEIKQHQ